MIQTAASEEGLKPAALAGPANTERAAATSAVTPAVLTIERARTKLRIDLILTLLITTW